MRIARSGRFVFVAQWVMIVLLPLFFFLGRGLVGAGMGWLAVLGVVYGIVVIIVLAVPPVMTLFDRTVRRGKATRLGYDISSFVLWAAFVLAALTVPDAADGPPLDSALTAWTGGAITHAGIRGDLHRLGDDHRPGLPRHRRVRDHRHRPVASPLRRVSIDRRAVALVAPRAQCRGHRRRGHARYRRRARAMAHRGARTRDPPGAAVGRHLQRRDRRSARPHHRTHRQADRAGRRVGAGRVGGGIRLSDPRARAVGRAERGRWRSLI